MGTNGNGNGGEAYVAKEDHLADEDTQRDQSWKRGDFSRPEVVKHALIEVSSYAEEAIRQNRANARRLTEIAGAQADIAENQGRLLAIMARVDRRTELTEARSEGLSFKVGRNEDLTEAARERLRDHDREIASLKARNERLDREEVEMHARLRADIEDVKSTVKKVADDVDELEDTQNRRPVSPEAATTALVTEVFRASLASQQELTRERRADVRAEAVHEREETSKTKWWVLGLIAFVVTSGVATALGRWSGHELKLDIQTPAPVSGTSHH